MSEKKYTVEYRVSFNTAVQTDSRSEGFSEVLQKLKPLSLCDLEIREKTVYENTVPAVA